MHAFHQRDFRKALPLFERATQGPVKEMAHSARTHLRMCESRLANAGRSDGLRFPGRKQDVRGLPEIFFHHLKDDIGEAHDLAEKPPEKVAELKALFEDLRSKGSSQPQ